MALILLLQQPDSACFNKDLCTIKGKCIPSHSLILLLLLLLLPDGTCSDNNLCTINDKCIGGTCTGTPKPCETTNQCKIAVCNPRNGNCILESKPNGTICDSGTASGQCTTDTCEGGVCVRGTDKDCSAFDDDCNNGWCNPTSGE
jgi:hypothetical protein